MAGLEKDCYTPSFWEGVNPFGKQAVQKKMEKLKEVCGLLKTAFSMDADVVAEEFLEKFCFVEDYTVGSRRGKDRATERLVKVPSKSLVRGLSKCNGISGSFGPISVPHFMVRSQLVKHIEGIMEVRRSRLHVGGGKEAAAQAKIQKFLFIILNHHFAND